MPGIVESNRAGFLAPDGTYMVTNRIAPNGKLSRFNPIPGQVSRSCETTLAANGFSPNPTRGGTAPNVAGGGPPPTGPAPVIDDTPEEDTYDQALIEGGYSWTKVDPNGPPPAN